MERMEKFKVKVKIMAKDGMDKNTKERILMARVKVKVKILRIKVMNLKIVKMGRAKVNIIKAQTERAIKKVI